MGFAAELREYDTLFNVRSKKSVYPTARNQKLKSKKRICSEVYRPTGKQSGEST